MTTVGAIGAPEAVLLLLGAVFFGILAGALACSRGRSVGLWAVLGCLLGPLAVIVIIVLPTREAGRFP